MDRRSTAGKQPASVLAVENEIMITENMNIRNYQRYALALLQERGFDTVILKGLGKAVSNTVFVAEDVKRTFSGLHQDTTIGSQEDSLQLEITGQVTVITITLSKKELDTSSPGYQPPIRGSVSGASYDRHAYAERGSPRGRGQSFQRQGRGYIGESSVSSDSENRHQTSGNMNAVNGVGNDRHGYMVRGRGRGRGRARGYGETNTSPIRSVNGSQSARNDYVDRGRGRGRYQTFRGRGSRYTQQESGSSKRGADLSANIVADGRCAYGGRGRGYNGGSVASTNDDSTDQEPYSESEESPSREEVHEHFAVSAYIENDIVEHFAVSAYIENDVVELSSDSDDSVDDNMATVSDSSQPKPADDNVALTFDSLSDNEIIRIGSAFGFVFPSNDITSVVAHLRTLEKQRAKAVASP